MEEPSHRPVVTPPSDDGKTGGRVTAVLCDEHFWIPLVVLVLGLLVLRWVA
jgi:hypothetical protein